MDRNLNDDIDDDGDDDTQDNEDESPDQSDNGDTDTAQAAADEHRNAVGTLLQSLQSRGIDVDSLAQEAGLDNADVDNMEDDDVLTLSKYVAQNHPELTQQVFSRFPLAQSLLGRFLG